MGEDGIHKQGRCGWATGELDVVYHDTEWGVPVRDERLLFEMLTLEGAQAGLSWSTILKKREGYRNAFRNFEVEKVARFTAKDVERLMGDASIVRNRLKIESTIDNAKALVAMHKQGETLGDVLWGHVDHTPIVNKRRSLAELPAQTEISKRISKDLKKRGFRFVGPTIVYALMQACGLVNDHLVTCPRHKACAAMG
jgi:DNA-3-methyladenine glycosylase I